MGAGTPQPLTGIVDDGSFVVATDGLRTRDPLDFPGYREALAGRPSQPDESVVAGRARVDGREVEIAYFDFTFFGGSMGEVAGERIARATERAATDRVPFVLMTSTGGARMQEGMRALVQMAKVVSARIELAIAGVPFIAILGHPTTGGVLASIGSLADVTLALDGAVIGFAGPRLVERFTGQPLEEGSHTAGSAADHGLVDQVVSGDDLRSRLRDALMTLTAGDKVDVAPPERPTSDPEPWDTVQAARAPDRPTTWDLARAIADRSFELRGDRGASSRCLYNALATVAGRPVVILALNRHAPLGVRAYREARRSLKVAENVGVPVVTIIDTPGADPSEPSDRDGIAREIAMLFESMFLATVPILAVVTGEGGSGGALAFACGDSLLIYEDAIFSVIAPESAAEILWRDPSRARDAARSLRLTGPELARLGIADGVLAGPLSPESLRNAVAYHLDLLEGLGDPAARRARWRHL